MYSNLYYVQSVEEETVCDFLIVLAKLQSEKDDF